MHIPDSMLRGTICPVTAVVSAAGVAGAAWAATRAKQKPGAGRFAAICALIFAAQMINFPISGGTSGHLLGGVLAAAILGIPFGVLALSVVVSVQCLVFSDGGVSVLGANILNMALIGAGVGGFLNLRLRRAGTGAVPAAGLAAWLGVMLAATAASLELWLDRVIPLGRVLPAMLGVHALIGLGEGAITMAAVALLAPARSGAGIRHSAAAPLIGAAVIALLLSPLASSLPDGLEWVAEKYRFLHEAGPVFVGPMPDYSFPAVGPAALSTSLAGLAGVAITFALAWVVGRGTRVKIKA